MQLSDIHRTIISTAMDGFLLVDRDGHILDANEAYCQMMGYCREELMGMTIQQLDAVETAEETRQHIARMIATGADRFESRHRRKDGSMIDVEVSVTFLPEHDCFFGFQRDITARKRFEEELRHSEERYRIVADFTHDWEYWLGADGLFRYVSPSCEQFTGYTAAQFIAEPGLLVEIVHPDDRELVQCHLRDDLSAAGTRALEFRIVTKEGDIRWINHVCQPVRGEQGEHLGRRASNRDITDRKQAEVALRASEEKYRALVQSVNCIIIRWDRHGIVTFLNDYGLAFFGFATEEVIGRHVCESIVPERDSEGRDLRRLMDAIFTDPQQYQASANENIRKNGERVWISWANRPMVAADDTVTEMLSVGVDITDQKRAERLVITINEALERGVAERTAELESALRHMESFSYSISHDLRAPLRAVDGFSRMLLEDHALCLDDEGKRVCGVISDSARDMGKLIDDLLAFSRVGRTALRTSSIDMGTLARSIFFELTAAGERERIDFQVSALPSAVGDPTLIRQVWMNLLSNAIKFSSKKDRAVIEVTAEDRGDEIIYSVRDNGAGFDMQYVEKLFGVFQRLHSTKEFEGTGVGLAIVQRIIHRHGGRVWAGGHPGKGAAFYFTLNKEGERA
ncbi:MAG TPA: PAS domain S-box protein [Geobacteraceae bacterium]